MKWQKVRFLPRAQNNTFTIFGGGCRAAKRRARLSDVANNTIVKIEAGKNQNPTLDTLKKIAKALGVSVDELIS